MIITRSTAVEMNLKRYFTGKPCKNEHIAERLTSSATCVECDKESTKRYRIKFPEKFKEIRRGNLNNVRASARKWLHNNKDVVKAHTAKRRAVKLNATPSWVDFEELKLIYLECPEGFQVDHIVPLQSNKICGLHVPWNLQYLTEEQNKSKGNRMSMEA